MAISGKLIEKKYEGLVFRFKITSSTNAGCEQRTTPLAKGCGRLPPCSLQQSSELPLCPGRLPVAAGNDRVPRTHRNFVKRCRLSAPSLHKTTWEGTAHLRKHDNIHEALPQKRLRPPFPQMSSASIVQDSCASLHILHVRCKFCVIRAVGRNLQFLHV